MATKKRNKNAAMEPEEPEELSVSTGSSDGESSDRSSLSSLSSTDYDLSTSDGEDEHEMMPWNSIRIATSLFDPSEHDLLPSQLFARLTSSLPMTSEAPLESLSPARRLRRVDVSNVFVWFAHPLCVELDRHQDAWEEFVRRTQQFRSQLMLGCSENVAYIEFVREFTAERAAEAGIKDINKPSDLWRVRYGGVHSYEYSEQCKLVWCRDWNSGFEAEVDVFWYTGMDRTPDMHFDGLVVPLFQPTSEFLGRLDMHLAKQHADKIGTRLTALTVAIGVGAATVAWLASCA